MMQFKKIALLFILFLKITNALALDYYTIPYKVESGDTFSSILKKFIKPGSIVNSKTPFVSKTVSNNRHIKKWEKIPTNAEINLYISSNFLDMQKFKSYQEARLPKKIEPDVAGPQQKIQPENVETQIKKISSAAKFKSSIFYMGSVGIFSQESTELANIDFRQNSPLTIGSALSFFPENKNYSFSFSAYYSYLLAATNNVGNNDVAIPPEIGGNFYINYPINLNNIQVYGGVDLERFSTFNLPAIKFENAVYVDNILVSYLTLGIAREFILFNRPILTKLSFSKSLVTSYKNNAVTSTGNEQVASTGKYSGIRFLFYLSHKISDKFYLHTLFKYHSLNGVSKLNSSRIGIGFGYNFF